MMSISVHESADQTAEYAAAYVEEVPAPAFRRAMNFLRDLDQRTVRADERGAHYGATRLRHRVQHPSHNPSDDCKGDYAVQFAKPDMRNQRLRRGRLIDFTRCRGPEKSRHERNGHNERDKTA